MTKLLFLLLAVNASALTVLPPQFSDDQLTIMVSAADAKTNAALTLWGRVDLSSGDWVLLAKNLNGRPDFHLPYHSQWVSRQVTWGPPVLVWTTGLYESMTIVETNIYPTGWGSDFGGNPVWNDGSTNVVTEHRCFFRLSQDIPETHLFGIWNVLTETNCIAGIHLFLQQEKYANAFWKGVSFGAQVVFTVYAIFLIRQTINLKDT